MTKSRDDAISSALDARADTVQPDADMLLAERIDEVESMLADGMSASRVVRSCSKKWGVTEFVARGVVDKTLEILSNTLTDDYIEQRRAHIIAMLEANLRRAIAHEGIPGIREATKIIEVLAKIDGLYAPDKISVRAQVDHSHQIAAFGFPDEKSIDSHLETVLPLLVEVECDDIDDSE